MKKGIAAIAVITVVVAGAASSCGGGGTKSDGMLAQAQAISIDDAINANSVAAQEWCDNYSSLVDMGWNNETIYSEMEVAGAFDSFGSTDGKEAFDHLVKWCYQH